MSRRDRMRELTIAEIKATARQQMAESGTAGVSLSAIARAMEISAPALYRYFASRDDLVTALIVDAFTALADAIEAAESAVAVQDLRAEDHGFVPGLSRVGHRASGGFPAHLWQPDPRLRRAGRHHRPPGAPAVRRAVPPVP